MKIEGNRQRDADTDARLEEQGWQVIRVWEREVAEPAADTIAAAAERERSMALEQTTGSS